MITGYNTDVRHNDVVFHVQTEDKGQGNPTIESLVYVGGQVLATKRASYADLLTEGKDDKSIVALMDHQHRTMIAAIRHGKLDERLMTLSGMRPDPHLAARPAAAEHAAVEAPPAALTRAAERSLDQVILEYLTNEADQEQLLMVFDGEPDLQRAGLGQDDLDDRRAAPPLRRPHRRAGDHPALLRDPRHGARHGGAHHLGGVPDRAGRAEASVIGTWGEIRADSGDGPSSLRQASRRRSDRPLIPSIPFPPSGGKGTPPPAAFIDIASFGFW